MPLPDERPRQSVANLIGRFEQQNKRQSASAAPVPSRSSSVVSQYTGDAAKEELKEKREWPPKPKIVAAGVFEPKVESSYEAAAKSKSPEPSAPAPLPEPTAPEPAEEPTVAETEVEPVAVSPVTPEKVASPSPPSSPPKKAATTAKPGAPRPSTATTRTTATPSKARESRTSAVGAKPTTRTPAKSPPSSFHPALSTSASVSSVKNTGTVKATPPRSRPSSRASVTPSRPKTPSSHSAARPKTPSSSRPKTPSHAISPPKTTKPGSGLFAPTAASLARARNADAGPPPPIRKPTASKETLERLIKPTAASISKARQPTLSTSSPAKNTAAARGATPATRGGATLKPRVGLAGAAKGKDPKVKAGAAAAAAGGAAAATGLAAALAQPDQQVAPQEADVVEDESLTHEHEESGATLVDEPEHHEEPAEIAQSENVQSEDLHEEHHEEPSSEGVEEQSVTSAQFEESIAESENVGHQVEHEEPPHVEIEAQVDETATEASADETPAAEPEVEISIEAEPELETEATHSETETHVDTESDTAAGSVTADKSSNDIEDIVAFLETAPKARPVSVNIPDEVADIPDIDED